MYLIKKYSMMWLIPLLLAMIMGGCENRDGILSPPDITVPTVSSTNPGSGNTGVPLNQKIAVTFSEPMDFLTLTTATFTLMQGDTLVSGTVSYTGITATFAPAGNLLPNSTYTVMITTKAKSLEGIALAHNFEWIFITGTSVTLTPPSVSSTTPADAATDVGLNQKIAATFSVDMDATTITTTTFTLKQGTTPVSGIVSYSGTTAIFAPADNLQSNTTYTATITTGAKDLAGNALATNKVWNFTTGSEVVVTSPTVVSTTPVNLEECVTLNKHITASFSKTMDASTLTTASFTIMEMNTSTFVSGTVSYSGKTATFIPLNDLKQNTTYTATITTGAKDLTGNALATNKVWHFKTIVPYTVTLSRNPLDGGAVSGGGIFYSCDSVTVSATLNAGYTFINWTNNGVEVSTYASYSFLIQEDITLVANFETGQQAPVLGTSSRFAILSNSDITNISTSDIRGDVGISPGVRSNITGFAGFERDPGLTYSVSTEVTDGFIYAADDADPTPAMLIAAKADAEAAYQDAVAAVRGTPTSISGNINGLTLYPGLYESGSSIEISAGGFLYLDALGDANAVFIIRSATTITTESTSEVVLAGNANASNVYWVAGSAITLGTNSRMKGSLIASTSISLLTGARLDGRALIRSAAAGQISLDNSIIILP